MTNEPVDQPLNEVQTPPVPFPRRLRKEKEEAQQKKFLENLKQLHINLPFIEALAQMPKYANFLKDLGASISLMPYTMYKKLGLGEPKDTRMSLELADRSIQYLRGIIENVLIKVDKFVLPIYFVILDILEDSRVPIILGRPFLATARAMIDAFNKKITLRVGDDELIFDVDQSIKRPTTKDDECYRIDDLDDIINEEAQELLANNELNLFLSRGLEKSIDQSDLECCESAGTRKLNDVKSEHLYSASANEIDEKKPELKNLPQHLEYAYLHGDKSFPIILISLPLICWFLLDKFEGVNFRRWQKKMHFLLPSMSVVYVLTTPISDGGDDATVEQIRKRNKLWNSLEAKYMAEDASNFKHTLKNKKGELTLVELGSHLRIEESLRAQDSDKPKGNNVAGPQ
ncbi:DNA-directed DNA polymerase [Tanacetum coccineum]